MLKSRYLLLADRESTQSERGHKGHYKRLGVQTADYSSWLRRVKADNGLVERGNGRIDRTLHTDHVQVAVQEDQSMQERLIQIGTPYSCILTEK